MSEWLDLTLHDLLIPSDERAGRLGIDLVLSVTEKRGIIPQTEVFKKRVATADVSNYKILLPLDIAYNPYLLWSGAIGQWLGDEPGITSPVYECFRVRAPHDPRFVGLLFESGLLGGYFDSTAVGSIPRRRRTTVPVFLAAKIRVPDPPTQQRITNLISCLDRHITTLQRELTSVILLRSSTMAEHLSRCNNTAALNDLAEVSQGTSLPKEVQGERSGEVSWFKIADMTGPGNTYGYVHAETTLTEERIRSLRGRILPKGSVVFPRVGAAVLTEKKRILEVDGAVDENHLVLNPKFDTNAEYLLALMESVRLSNLVRKGAVPSLNMKLIGNVRVPFGGGSEQQEMGHALRLLRLLARSLDVESQALKALRAAMLANLLGGYEEIPESYDALLHEVG